MGRMGSGSQITSDEKSWKKRKPQKNSHLFYNDGEERQGRCQEVVTLRLQSIKAPASTGSTAVGKQLRHLT